MPKFLITRLERYGVVVEADSEAEAKRLLWDSDNPAPDDTLDHLAEILDGAYYDGDHEIKAVPEETRPGYRLVNDELEYVPPSYVQTSPTTTHANAAA